MYNKLILATYGTSKSMGYICKCKKKFCGLFATHSFTNSNKDDEDLGSNANKEAVHKAQLENRERCKAASQAKKEKDKEDREKQKKDGDDRKKKAQDKTAKVERKR
jgi:hypothetical protein